MMLTTEKQKRRCENSASGTATGGGHRRLASSARFLVAVFALLFGVCALSAGAAVAVAPQHAEAYTITLHIDRSDYTGGDYVLDSDENDYTPGEPVGQLPTERGKQNDDGSWSYLENDALRALVAKLESDTSGDNEGFIIHYGTKDGSTTSDWGAEFDWMNTPTSANSDMDIYLWVETPVSYKMRVEYNDGIHAPNTRITVGHGKTVSLDTILGNISSIAEIKKNGYSWSGWVDNNGNDFYPGVTRVYKDMTISPKWKVANVGEIQPITGAPDVIEGTAYVGKDWWVGLDSAFPVTIISDGGLGILSGLSATGWCKDHTAAVTLSGTYNYTATRVSGPDADGNVTYNIVIDPPGSADEYGFKSNQYGLIGYQRVETQIKAWVNVGGKGQVVKKSSNTGITDGNGMYSTSGAEFQIINGAGEVVDTLTTGDDGSSQESKLMPPGQYIMHEIKSPEGYAIAGDVTFEIVSGETTVVEFSDPPETYTIPHPYKMDEETVRFETQGDATLAGAHFKIRYYQADTIEQAQKFAVPDKEWVFETDENGIIECDPSYLVQEQSDQLYTRIDPATDEPVYCFPLGVISWQEIKSPEGYLMNDEVQWLALPSTGNEINVAADEDTFITEEEVIRGGVSVQKFASEVSDDTVGQSQNGSFPDIRLQSTLRLATALDDVSSVLNAASASASDPQRFVEMIVACAPVGDKTVITPDMFGMEDGTSTENAKDENAVAQAGATFKGAQITVYNISREQVNINGKWVPAAKDAASVKAENAVAVLTLDEHGFATTSSDLLPYGTYVLKETKAPTGYHLNKNWSRTVQIREDGKIVAVTSLPETGTDLAGLDEQVIRGDYKFVKTAEDSQNTLANVPFLLVNLQSGENHVIVTNENGEFYSNAYIDGNPYNLHTNNTNANDDAITWTEDGAYTIDDEKLDVYAGVWFTGYGPLNDPTGELAQKVEPNDSLGALPYGDYALIELTAEANKGYVNIARTFNVSRDGFTIPGGTINDKWIEVELQTTAHDAVTGDNYGSLEEDTTTIIDEVAFSNGLRANEEYEFVGTLMDKETGEALLDENGSEIIASTKHVVTEDEAANGGAVEVVFEDIPSELLRGKTTVVFEDLYDANGNWIAAHADIEDEGQTVYYPEIHTTATDGITGDHEGYAQVDGIITINDEVAYSGLKVGETYTMTGTLMDKETGKAFEGVEPVSVEFVAEASEGTVEVAFEVPAELLRGKTTVVFESCYQGEREVAVHADIEDEGQTVSYPVIGTQATDGFDGDKVFSGQQEVTLVDTVAYENLTPGVEYTMVGALMDKQTGAPVPGVDTVVQKFVPETPDGEMEMVFTFNVVDLVGHDIVVFEDLYRDFNGDGETPDNERVAQHADINDEGQTVNVRDAGLADDLIEQELAQTGSGTGIVLAVAATAACAMFAAGVIAWRRNAAKRR